MLGKETRGRFAPHSFDRAALEQLFAIPGNHQGFITEDQDNGGILAYAVVRKGYLDHERERLALYGWQCDEHTDGVYAPSVADGWQGQGLGSRLLERVRKELRHQGIRRMVLWGGVQATNLLALAYYKKHGFRELGRFDWKGANIDMALDAI
jgi:GNAT superfamily N-acetyltransferase